MFAAFQRAAYAYAFQETSDLYLWAIIVEPPGVTESIFVLDFL